MKLSLILPLLAFACQPLQPPDDPVPDDHCGSGGAETCHEDDTWQPDREPSDEPGCPEACANLKALGCDGGEEADCVAACDNVEDLYRRGESELTLNPACLARSETCEAMGSCRR